MTERLRRGILHNAATDEVVARDARLAPGVLGQLRGLIGCDDIPPEFALGFPGCDCVHTIGVRFPIDVAYCDAGGRVLRVVSRLAPGRISPRAPGARIAWEMGADRLAGHVRVGDILVLAPE